MGESEGAVGDPISRGSRVELGWADLWVHARGLGVFRWAGEAKECSKTIPNCHVLPSFPFLPQHGKIKSELIKAADCLEMEDKG